MRMRYAGLLTSTASIVVLGTLLLFAVSGAAAQTTTSGTIDGRLTDSTGAAVPGMTVTATRQGGGSQSAMTNDEGSFRMMNLKPGIYTVTVEAAGGFAKFEQASVEVNLSRTTEMRAQLRPAGADESVAVTASSTATVERPAPTTTGRNAEVTTNGGLTTVTFDTKFGNVRVNLPDDMRAGDTISGTVIAEPKGQTPDERAANQAKLRDHVVTLTAIVDPKPPAPLLPIVMFDLRKGLAQSGGSSIVNGTFSAPTKVNACLFFQYWGDSARNRTSSPIECKIVYEMVSPFDAVITPDPKITPTFIIPPLGQTGRPIVVTGPFDGDSSNTTLNWAPVTTLSNLPELEDAIGKGTDISMLLQRPQSLAESPRKAVFEAPSNVTGPIKVNLKEGNVETKGTYRNVGVQLSAPKTNLLRGEKTTLTVQVNGLEGIKESVPLTLECKGVITMEGGIYQPLMIQPSEVGAGGRYTTTRGITGVQTGGWEATATVVTGRFNVWLQHDPDPNRIFHFNSFTGEYVFACGGGSCRSGAGGTSSQPPPESPVTPPPVTLTGTGKLKMKGCIITLTHNAPDRRVFAKLDACTKTGDASVETKSPTNNFNITDKNTADNAVESPPPK